MGIDGLHRVEVLQVPGQVVLRGEGRRPQLVGICCCGGIGAGIVVVMVLVVVVQAKSVGEGIGIRLTTIAVAAAAAMTTTSVLLAAVDVVVVWCRHGVPRARQHSGRAFSGGAWALEKPAGPVKTQRRVDLTPSLQAVSGRIGSEGEGGGGRGVSQARPGIVCYAGL